MTGNVERRTNRLVFVGDVKRCGGREQFESALCEIANWNFQYPVTLFAAGVNAASADVLILDLLAIPFSDTLDVLSALRVFCPRTSIVLLLEPGMQVSSIPHGEQDIVLTDPVSVEKLNCLLRQRHDTAD